MNIFVLDNDPTIAAQSQNNKHIVKMTLETAQLLCSQFHPGAAPYNRTHYNHPCSIWARSSVQNYEWLLSHGFALAKEYTYRYEKTHKSSGVIQWCQDNYSSLNLPNIGMTAFALAMPDKYKVFGDAVQSYKNYYLGDKREMAVWKKRTQPDWWK